MGYQIYIKDNSEMTFFQKWGSVASTITAILTLLGAVFVFDDRYAKHAVISKDLDQLKLDIISEMRTEVSKNRIAMIQNMQREADDLDFEIYSARQRGEEPSRYLIDKNKQINRDIETLKSYESTND